MIVQSRVSGAAAAILLLLTPRLAAAQAIAAFNPETMGSSTDNPILGAMASGPFNPELGPKGQDAPKRSTLKVRVYDAKMEYARGFADIQMGQFHQAEGEFQNALSVHPDDMKSLYMLGVAKAGDGDFKGALPAFEKALKVAPQQIAVRREYAVTLAKLGQADKAQAQLEMLRLRADACAGSCAQADDYRAALTRIESVLSVTVASAD